jgi:FkbM family methyltransferase
MSLNTTSTLFTRLIRAASRALSFASAFGIVNGFWFYLVFTAKRQTKKPFAISVPGLGHRIWLRPLASDVYTFFEILVDGQYEFSTFPQSKRLTSDAGDIHMAKPPLIVDCGANIGLSSIWLATKFPHARIYSIEPDPENFRALTKNTAEYRNIIPINAAIWDTHTQLYLGNIDAPPNARQVNESAPPEGSVCTTQAVTVEEIMQGADAERAMIVKVDIEGAEACLFRSNTDWLDRVDLLIIELHDWMLPGQRSSQTFLRRISRGDFEVAQNGENFFCFNLANRG